MRAVKSRDTRPEIRFRKELWRQGFRSILNCADMFGKPDLVLKKRRAVIFIDGDFWHGAQWKRRGFHSLNDQLKKVNNKTYWIKKIKRNMERDHKVNEEYLRNGWAVVRFWESEVNRNIQGCIKKLIRVTKRNKNESE